MTLDIRAVAFGRAAARVLRDEIAVAQARDALAPVTVVVPRNVTGLATRRLLASGDLGPAPDSRRTGLVNVRFLTLARLADEVAGGGRAAEGSLPATPSVLQAAARMALDHADGPFQPVREHPSMARALVAAYRDLGGVSPATRKALASGSLRAAEVVALVEAMEARLRSGWYDEGSRIDDAVTALAAGAAGADTGALVVHLPLRLTARDRRLLGALAAVRPVTVVVGLTGEDAADATARDLVDRLAADHPSARIHPPPDPPVPPLGTAVVSAPASDAEVRAAVRGVMARRRAGTRFERMAIVHGGAGVYERLVREALSSAGIPCSGVGTRTLAATLPGRVLLGALDLPERGWRRDDVAAWLSAGPVLDGPGEPVPAAAWDLLSREAGVTAGLDAWHRHLAALADDCDARLLELDGPAGIEAPPATADRLRRRKRAAGRLDAFVGGLAGRLGQAPDSWTGWAAWVDGLLDHVLGRPTQRPAWPTEEEEALIAIRARVGALTVLDRFGAAPDRGTFRQALQAELDAAAPQTSRFGTGVLVGPVELLVGLDLDTVFVLGMVDGAFPGRDRDDALLPDDERAAAGDDLPLRGRHRHDAHREYLAALAAAPERVLSFARGDQRRGREQRPARWLLDTLGVLEGADRRLFSRDVERLGAVGGFTVLPSFTEGVRRGDEPYAPADRDLRSLLRWVDAGRDPASHPLATAVPAVGAGLLARRSRRGRAFTRFDGRIDRAGIPSPATATALSPTSLETFAACPRRYLMERVLRIEEHPRPEQVLSIDPADRGSLVHAVLERFIAPQLDLPRHRRIRPGTPWSADDHRRIERLAAEVGAEFEAKGLVGRRLLWEYERSMLVRSLHRFLEADDRYRAAGGWVPERVELAFGPGHGEPVTLDLPEGRRLAFKGFIDRVDRAEDGSLSVLDYKTGSTFGFDGLPDDPVLRGTKLQLPLYGLAARSRLGDGPVSVAYWFVSERGRYGQRGYHLEAPVLGRLRGVATVLVDAIESGTFPARPGPAGSNCTFCAFEAMCPGNRQRSWERVARSAELSAYVELADGDGVTR